MSRAYGFPVQGGMKKAWVIAGSLLLAASVFAVPLHDFDYYQVILDRKPFGQPPPPAPEPPPSLEQSFAKNIRMCALLEDESGVKIGLIDTSNNKNFYLTVGQTEEDIELVSASYENEEAVIRKGSEMAVIKLQSGEITPLSAAQQQERLNAPTGRRMSYAERRLARQQQRQQAAEPPPQPKYTGEELEKHLQNYQMEVIRQGLPPLPIPLTPEMDQQLVNEGVLPPAE